MRLLTLCSSLLVFSSTLYALPLGHHTSTSIQARDQDGPSAGSQAFALTIDRVNSQLDTFSAGLKQFLGGDLQQAETLQQLYDDLTYSIHAGADALSDPEVHIEGKEVHGVLALLKHAESTVQTTIQLLIQSRFALLLIGAADYISEALPALGRAFESFKDLASIQSFSQEHEQSNFSSKVHARLDRIVGWINVGLVSFNKERISNAWIDESGLVPCDQWTDKHVACKPKEEHIEGGAPPDQSQTQTEDQGNAGADQGNANANADQGNANANADQGNANANADQGNANANADQGNASANPDHLPTKAQDDAASQATSTSTSSSPQPESLPTTPDGKQQASSEANSGTKTTDVQPPPATYETNPQDQPSQLTQVGKDRGANAGK